MLRLCGLQVAVAAFDGVSYHLLVGNNYRKSLAFKINLAGCAPTPELSGLRLRRGGVGHAVIRACGSPTGSSPY